MPTTSVLYSNIRLLVCDMAGTTVRENGLVYRTLFHTMRDFGLNVSEADMHGWHGRNKHEVLHQCYDAEHIDNNDVSVLDPIDDHAYRKFKLCQMFDTNLHEAYFANDSPLALIDDGLPDVFDKLRTNGTRVALNTGYPIHLQKAILEKLDLDKMVDAYVSSEEVTRGRPYPYMIHHLMAQFSIASGDEVIKVGDSTNDILEGLHAGCIVSAGVLTGAEDADTLRQAGATTVLGSVMELESMGDGLVRVGEGCAAE